MYWPTLYHLDTKIGEKGEFVVYWSAQSQSYTVLYKGKFLIGNKYRFSEVKSYLD